MGEAKRRKEMGLPPREKKIKKDERKAGFISNLSAKYPFLPFILGGVLLTVLIVDLVNYYKWDVGLKRFLNELVTLIENYESVRGTVMKTWNS